MDTPKLEAVKISAFSLHFRTTRPSPGPSAPGRPQAFLHVDHCFLIVDEACGAPHLLGACPGSSSGPENTVRATSPGESSHDLGVQGPHSFPSALPYQGREISLNKVDLATALRARLAPPKNMLPCTRLRRTSHVLASGSGVPRISAGI